MHAHGEFRAGSQRGASSSGGENQQAAQRPERDRDQGSRRGDGVRVVRPAGRGDQSGDSGGGEAKGPADAGARPADASGAPAPGGVGKPASGAGRWSGVGASQEPAPSVQRPDGGSGASGWSGVGASGDRPSGAGEGSASDQPSASTGGSETGAGSTPDASADKGPQKREPEPHYSRRKPRKKVEKPANKGEGADDKQTEQAPAGPKRER